MNSEILGEIREKLKKTFGIDSYLTNTSQRLHVIATLLKVYDDHWSLETVGGGLVGQHGREDEEFTPLQSHEIYSVKRWLRALDLGYFIVPKHGDAFCSNVKKYLHLVSVLMDKIEAHHGPAKLKTCIRLLVQRHSRSDRRLTYVVNKTSTIQKTNKENSKEILVPQEPFIQRSEIPRTPIRPISLTSPDDPEIEAPKDTTFDISSVNRTYDVSSGHVLGHSSTLSKSFPLSFVDNSYIERNNNILRFSPRDRRSSNDKNCIPTGRQIPATPITRKALSEGSCASSFDAHNKISGGAKHISAINKRWRSSSLCNIKDYVLETTMVQGNSKDEAYYGLDKNCNVNEVDRGSVMLCTKNDENLFKRDRTSTIKKDKIQRVNANIKVQSVNDEASTVNKKLPEKHKFNEISKILNEDFLNQTAFAKSETKDEENLPKIEIKTRKSKKKVISGNENLAPRTRLAWKRQMSNAQEKLTDVEVSKELTNMLEQKVDHERQTNKGEDPIVIKKPNKRKEKSSVRRLKNDFLPKEMPVRRSTRIQVRGKDILQPSEDSNISEDINKYNSQRTIHKALQRLSIGNEDITSNLVTEKVEKTNLRNTNSTKKGPKKENIVPKPKRANKKRVKS